MGKSSKQNRVVATIAYLLVIIAVQWLVVGQGFPINEKSLWFFNGLASLLLGSRLLNPHFVPPADVATNSFVAGATMAAALAVPSINLSDKWLIAVVLALCITTLLAALAIILVRRDRRLETRTWVLSTQKALQAVGSPRVIFTIIILALTWLFHRQSTVEVFSILCVWTFIVAFDPIEHALNLLDWIRGRASAPSTSILGEVVAYQHPDLVLIRQNDDVRHPTGTLMALSDLHGPTKLGLALNYVGRDEGMLLRTLSLEVPKGLRKRVELASVSGDAACLLNLSDVERAELGVLDRVGRLCGIVDSETTTSFLEIEIINDKGLFEGRLVDVKIGADTVIYQVIDGVTREEAVQQKNKYGFARAKARKIGRWDSEKGKFYPVSWIPTLNAPVFIKADAPAPKDNAGAVGHFPSTDFHVGISVSDCVTHNTAILGILGVGKSYLAAELVERMLAEEVKVICLDLTDQYAELLTDHVDTKFHETVHDYLRKNAEGRPPGSKETGGSIHKFRKAVRATLERFMADDTLQQILILNPAAFVVSKQSSGYNEATAAFSDLTPAEITAIISDEALSVCQGLGMTNKARTCLVYEEAHTLVPEWSSVAADGDKYATAASARAILQGRKFGLGCLLVTQRTANVTKTILNQCNTIFAMRTFDDTGKDFLSNYIGSEYARILPSLKDRHAVLFGKSSSCDDPVLIRLNDRDDFIAAFRQSATRPTEE